MKDFKKLIREAYLGNPLNENKKPKQVNIAVVDGFGVYSVKVEFEDGSTEKFRSEEEAEEKYNLDGIPRQEFEMDVSESVNEDRYLKNQDSYIRISEPSFRKDKNNPNFLSAYINYDTGPGVGIALGKETMAGQIRRLSSAEAVRQMEIIARKLEDSYDLEDIEVTDLENGVVELFAVSDDFIDMDPRSELSMAMLNETAGTFGDGVTDEIKAKYNEAAMDEYGKPFAELDVFQKQELMRAIVKYTGPEFRTDFQQRRQGDLDDEYDGMTDYQRGRMDEELKLGVKYELPTGETGYIMTGGSKDPKDWTFSANKESYLSVKDKLKPIKKQPGKYDGAYDMGMGKGHHIDELELDVTDSGNPETTGDEAIERESASPAFESKLTTIYKSIKK
jgi:hypothetical protein